MTREKKLLFIFSFNVLLMALEIAGGLWSGSLALISDAGHMLTDSLAILLSYLAIYWSGKPATAAKTYGYHRTEILVALTNGLTLLGVSGYIFFEAINRFLHPEPVKAGILLVIASIGLVGNLAGMLALHTESHENLNIRGAFFHMLGDTLSSVGVIIGGIVIALTGWTLIDPLLSILIGGIVLRGALDLIRESGEVLLESAPRDIDPSALKADVEAFPGVREFHEIHVWTITSGIRALSAHVLIDNISTKEGQEIIHKIKALLADKYAITHSTIEAECEACHENSCVFTATTTHQ
jgi:cobalt-zinc-cadmium efflux system protein